MVRTVAAARKYLEAPVDAASLAVFRVAFGAMMMTLTVRYFTHGWIREYYLVPTHFFSYYGFAWVRPWPGSGMYVHYALMLAAAACVTMGVWYRPAMIVFGALFTYAHLIDQTNYLNHYFQVTWLCLWMMAMPLDRMLSIRSWRDPAATRPVVPRWMLGAIRFQVGLVYVFGGIAKLRSDWLIHAQPLSLWLAANREFPVLGALFSEKWMAYAFSWAGALFDLTIVLWLSIPRTRAAAYVVVILFHLITAKLFQIGMFPWIMIASAPVMFSPSWPRRWIALAHASTHRSIEPAPEVGRGLGLRKRTLAGISVFALFQVLCPLRHWLYPGNALWTEEGFRFAWNVMLMEKSGSVSFDLVEPSSGKKWTLEPTEFLTRYQTKMMSTQPDMILKAAHIAKAIVEEKGHSGVKVYARSAVVLNARRPAPLVDPTVDLSQERDGFGHKNWILPAPSSPPEL